jgi:uncharacterized protein (TIGR02677 family)
MVVKGRLPTDMFRFTIGDRSEIYTAVLHVFGEANERLETALGLAELGERLQGLGWVGALAEADLFDVLKQLKEWHLLDVTQNHTGTYRTADEYERRNLLYSLTRNGEAALAGLEHAAAVLASTGALQTAVLDAIADRLAELSRLLADPGSGDRRVFSAVQELEGHLEGLRGNTKQFNGQLQRLLRADGTDHETFHEVKAATVAYLQEFLTNLDLRARVIADAIAAIEAQGVDRMQRRALAGAELPALGLDDPGPDWLAHRRGRWDGLRAWFLPQNDVPPRVEQLHLVARRAIVALLQTLDRINESRRRASSTGADLRELARWFTLAEGEDDVHRLWSVAFGLGSARHAHLVHPDPELVPTGVAWTDAPAVPVSALLRSSGRAERFSRTGKVRDVTAIKRARADRAHQERAELEAAWRQLATVGQIRVSDLGRLDHATFERLLDLIGRALGAEPATDGARRSLSADGQVGIALWPSPDAVPATLHTPRGTFTGPNYLIQIDVGTAAEPGAIAGRRKRPETSGLREAAG